MSARVHKPAGENRKLTHGPWRGRTHPVRHDLRRGVKYGSRRLYLDRALAVPLLLGFIPIIAMAAILVRLTSKGPAFYTQVRLGKNGKPFIIYKLRTMYHGVVTDTGLTWCRKNDRRVTPFGRILRDTHVDEFPQLLNVLRGEMALIGPRPERPEIAADLAKSVTNYNERIRVAPGITGLAQIHLPPDSNLESVRKKLTMDLYYIEQCGLWLDFRILLTTALSLFGFPMHWSQRMLSIVNPLRLLPQQAQEALTHS